MSFAHKTQDELFAAVNHPIFSWGGVCGAPADSQHIRNLSANQLSLNLAATMSVQSGQEN